MQTFNEFLTESVNSLSTTLVRAFSDKLGVKFTFIADKVGGKTTIKSKKVNLGDKKSSDVVAALKSAGLKPEAEFGKSDSWIVSKDGSRASVKIDDDNQLYFVAQ